MKEFLSSGQVGNIEYNTQKQIRESVQKRWDNLGFTEGLEGMVKENVATLYENEAKHLIYEATDANNSGSFETVVFPIIRRVFSKLLANDIVSVQAMNLPVGKLFFMIPVTSQREWENVGTDENGNDIYEGSHKGLMGYNRVNKNKEGVIEPRYYLPDEVINGLDGQWVYRNASGDVTVFATYKEALNAAEADGAPASSVRKCGPEIVKFFQKSLYDLFYDDFLYDNSKGKVTIKVGTVKFAELLPNGAMKSSDSPVIKACGLDDTVRNILIEVNGFNSFNASKLTGPDGNEMDTEEFLASLKVVANVDIPSESGTACYAMGDSIPFRVMTQKYGKGIVEYGSVCDAEGKMYIELDLAKPTSEQGQTIDGFIGISMDQASALTPSSFSIAWAQYDSLELETEIGEVSFKLDSVTVSVTERKLRATWSPELAQDVSAFHNIDAEAELTALLSEQIAAEIDREILRDLRKGAPWQAQWDVNGWRRMAAFSTNYTQKDWNQELFTKINQISAQINKATLYGGASFIVVSSEISALFDNLEYFHVSDASAESDTYNMGIERIGSLSSRYQVYRDPYAPFWSLIVGHRGKSLLETGYIYAPYVPLMLTPVMYNPMNAAPIKYIATRYAKKMINNKFFGHIRVNGLVHWDTKELR